MAMTATTSMEETVSTTDRIEVLAQTAVEQVTPTTMEQITPTTMEQLTAEMEKLKAGIEKLTATMEKNGPPIRNVHPYGDPYGGSYVPSRKGRQKHNRIRNPKDNPKLWNLESLIYGVYKLPDNVCESGGEDLASVEFFPEMNEGNLFENQGVTGNSILEKAAYGDFSEVMKLKELYQNTQAAEFPIKRIMATLWYATCEPLKRKLIHWVALYNQLEILKWMLSPRILLFSKEPPPVEDDNQRDEDDQRDEEVDHRDGEDDQRVAEDKQLLEPDDQLVERKGTESPVDYGRRFNMELDRFDAPTSKKVRASVNVQDLYGYTPLHLATMENHEDMVKVLLASDYGYSFQLDIDVAATSMPAVEGKKRNTNGLTPLHIAVRNGSLPIVKMLLEYEPNNMCYMVMTKSSSGKTALHYGAEYGHFEVVRCLLEALNAAGKGYYVNDRDVFRQTPLYLAASNQQLDALEVLLREGEDLKVNIVNWEGITALDIAKRNEEQHTLEKETERNQRIVDMLESYDVNWLLAERQKYANAANFLLVGAALIAGVTYAGWLQPPLGMIQYYDFPSSDPVSPPGTFDSYVGVEQHWDIQIFWVFNSMSFFCSVATFIVGVDAGIPKKCASLREEVVQLRNSVVRASFILSVAILFVIGAFASAGILVLPPIGRQRAPTYATVVVGATFCIILLTVFIKKLWIWFRSPSLQFKMEKDHSSGEAFTNDGSTWRYSRLRTVMPLAELQRYYG